MFCSASAAEAISVLLSICIKAYGGWVVAPIWSIQTNGHLMCPCLCLSIYPRINHLCIRKIVETEREEEKKRERERNENILIFIYWRSFFHCSQLPNEIASWFRYISIDTTESFDLNRQINWICHRTYDWLIKIQEGKKWTNGITSTSHHSHMICTKNDRCERAMCLLCFCFMANKWSFYAYFLISFCVCACIVNLRERVCLYRSVLFTEIT